MHLDRGRAFGMSEQSGQSDDDVSVSEYCAEKLQSLSEGELLKSRLRKFSVDRVVILILQMRQGPAMM